MADREFFPHLGDIGHNRAVVTFALTLNGSSDPTIQSNASNFVATATYAATGKVTVTLGSRDSYNKVIYADAWLRDIASPDGAYATVGNVSNEGTTSALSFVVSTFNASGTLTEFSSRQVGVILVLRNTNSSGPGVP